MSSDGGNSWTIDNPDCMAPIVEAADLSKKTFIRKKEEFDNQFDKDVAIAQIQMEAALSFDQRN